MSWLARVGRWLRAQVQEVPESVAVCEFNCARLDCCLGDWERCERRYNSSVEAAASPSPARSEVAMRQGT